MFIKNCKRKKPNSIIHIGYKLILKDTLCRLSQQRPLSSMFRRNYKSRFENYKNKTERLSVLAAGQAC